MAYKQIMIPCPDRGCKGGKITILHPAKSGATHDIRQKVTCPTCKGKGKVSAPARRNR